jgi:hypothetical protein
MVFARTAGIGAKASSEAHWGGLIARLRAPPHWHERRWDQMREATTAKVRLDADKAAYSNGWFDRLPRAHGTRLLLREMPKRAILAPQPPRIGAMSALLS